MFKKEAWQEAYGDDHENDDVTQKGGPVTG